MSSSTPPLYPRRTPSQGSINHGASTIMRPRPIDVFPGSFALGVHEQQQRQFATYPPIPLGHSQTSTLHLPGASFVSGGGKDDRYRDNADSDVEDPPMSQLIAMPSHGMGILSDIFSWSDWQNRHLWKAGVVEFMASASFNFLTGLIPVTLSNFPLAAVPLGVFIANGTAVSLLIFALSTATGAHINPLISISTTFSGLCHPVRMFVYVLCQVVGGALGGAFLRVGLGYTKALQLHNGGCWIEPGGEISIGQAVTIEFMSVFSLLLICYGVGLDPRQAQLYGAAMGPVLIGTTIGLITALTSTIAPGYSGAGMFPGRCFGLAAGIGEFQSSHWVWWIPDIAAAFAHSLLYRFAPPYVHEPAKDEFDPTSPSKPRSVTKFGKRTRR